MADPLPLPDWTHDNLLDAGDVGCGELIMFLKETIQPLPRGTRILLVARDYAAGTEVDAWCRMTGNHLARFEDRFFLVVRRPLED